MATALDQVLKLFITADGRGLSAGLQRSLGEIKNFSGTAQRAFSGIQSAFAALGVTLSAGAVAVGIKKTIDGMDALNDASKRLGVSTEALSALGYAAEQSGSSMEGLQTGLRFLNRNLVEAQQKSKEMATTLRQFGITALDDTESALAKLADAFAAMPNGAQKTAAAIKIFGRSGAELIPLLNEGSAGLAKFRAEAERLGIVVSGPAAQAADDFNDSMNKAGKSLTAVGISIANTMLPGLTQMAKGMADAANEGEGLSGVIAALGREITNLFRYGSNQAALKSGLTKELEQQEKILEQQIKRREELLKEYSQASFTGLFGNKKVLGEKLDNVANNIMQTEEEIGRLNKQLIPLQQAEAAAAKSAKEMANGTREAGKAAEETAAKLVGLQTSYAKLIKDIREGKKEALAGPVKDVKESSVLDINSLREKAKQALEKGDADSIENAQAFIKRAKAINDYLFETKQITAGYYQTQADLLLKLAEQGEQLAEGVEIKTVFGYDPAQVQGAAEMAWSTMQATLNEKGPLTVGIVQTGASEFTNLTADSRQIISAAGITGKAAGGPIIGPGTSVSDSILARLSAGEFVVRAAAVKNYGLGFLERLNSMALPRFATGGMVSTGTPVNLYLPGGQSFPMTAQPSVAKQLASILSTEVLKRGRR